MHHLTSAHFLWTMLLSALFLSLCFCVSGILARRDLEALGVCMQIRRTPVSFNRFHLR